MSALCEPVCLLIGMTTAFFAHMASQSDPPVLDTLAWAIGARRSSALQRSSLNAWSKDNVESRKVVKVAHRTAQDNVSIGAFVVGLCQQFSMGTRRLEFIAILAAASDRVRAAGWAGWDLHEAVRTLPELRGKAGREHRIAGSQLPAARL